MSARATTVERYHTLLRQRNSGRANGDELGELADLARELQLEPAPPKFNEAMVSLAKDRQALRESMERIEKLLNRAAPVKKSAVAPKQAGVRPHTLEGAVPLHRPRKAGKKYAGIGIDVAPYNLPPGKGLA